MRAIIQNPSIRKSNDPLIDRPFRVSLAPLLPGVSALISADAVHQRPIHEELRVNSSHSREGFFLPSRPLRSWNMSRIRGKHTSPEIVVRKLLHRMGYRFRLHVRIPIPPRESRELTRKGKLQLSNDGVILNNQIRVHSRGYEGCDGRS